MVSMLDANMLNGSSRGRNHCAVFLSKVLVFSHSLFLPRKINFYRRIARKPEVTCYGLSRCSGRRRVVIFLARHVTKIAYVVT